MEVFLKSLCHPSECLNDHLFLATTLGQNDIETKVKIAYDGLLMNMSFLTVLRGFELAQHLLVDFRVGHSSLH